MTVDPERRDSLLINTAYHDLIKISSLSQGRKLTPLGKDCPKLPQIETAVMPVLQKGDIIQRSAKKLPSLTPKESSVSVKPQGKLNPVSLATSVKGHEVAVVLYRDAEWKNQLQTVSGEMDLLNVEPLKALLGDQFKYLPIPNQILRRAITLAAGMNNPGLVKELMKRFHVQNEGKDAFATAQILGNLLITYASQDNPKGVSVSLDLLKQVPGHHNVANFVSVALGTAISRGNSQIVKTIMPYMQQVTTENSLFSDLLVRAVKAKNMQALSDVQKLYSGPVPLDDVKLAITAAIQQGNIEGLRSLLSDYKTQLSPGDLSKFLETLSQWSWNEPEAMSPKDRQDALMLLADELMNRPNGKELFLNKAREECIKGELLMFASLVSIPDLLLNHEDITTLISMYYKQPEIIAPLYQRFLSLTLDDTTFFHNWASILQTVAHNNDPTSLQMVLTNTGSPRMIRRKMVGEVLQGAFRGAIRSSALNTAKYLLKQIDEFEALRAGTVDFASMFATSLKQAAQQGAVAPVEFLLDLKSDFINASVVKAAEEEAQAAKKSEVADILKAWLQKNSPRGF